MSTSSTESGVSPVYRLIPSPTLRILLLALPGFTIGVIALTAGIPDGLRWSAVLLILVVAGQSIRSHWPGRPGAISEFAILPSGDVYLWRNNGAAERRRLDDAFVSPALVVLSLGGAYPRQALVIPADALGGEGHRRLRRDVGSR